MQVIPSRRILLHNLALSIWAMTPLAMHAQQMHPHSLAIVMWGSI